MKGCLHDEFRIMTRGKNRINVAALTDCRSACSRVTRRQNMKYGQDLCLIDSRIHSITAMCICVVLNDIRLRFF